MVQCAGLTEKGIRCKKSGSQLAGENPNYCYLHQNCKRDVSISKETGKRKVEIRGIKKKSSGRALKSLVEYQYPIDFDYIDIEDMKLDEINIENINKWIGDVRVRVNLLNNMLLSIYGNYFPSSNQQIMGINILKSPYMEKYLNYISEVLLPAYESEMKEKAIDIETTIGDKLNILVKAALGHLPATKNDYLMIFSKLFHHAKITNQPNIGNCFFCSIGENIGKTDEEVRQDVKLVLDKMDRNSYKDFVENAISACPDSTQFKKMYESNQQEFMADYSNIILKSCTTQNKTDCDDCIWGGSFLDPLLSEYYNMPILSIVLTPALSFVESETEEYLLEDLSENIVNALQYLNMLEDNDEVIEIEPSQMIIIMQYTTPSKYSNDEGIFVKYLNEYTGPFISYLINVGKAHIDSINLGQWY